MERKSYYGVYQYASRVWVHQVPITWGELIVRYFAIVDAETMKEWFRDGSMVISTTNIKNMIS